MRGKTPDHTTLARAAKAILGGRRIKRMLDLLAEWFTLARQLSTTLAVGTRKGDASIFPPKRLASLIHPHEHEYRRSR